MNVVHASPRRNEVLYLFDNVGVGLIDAGLVRMQAVRMAGHSGIVAAAFHGSGEGTGIGVQFRGFYLFNVFWAADVK